MITSLMPLLVAIGAFIFLHERISRTCLAGFLLAVAGVVWLSLAGTPDEHAPAPLLGNFFEFLAMVCAMGYTLLLKYLSERYSAFLLTAMQAFVGAPFFFVLALCYEPIPTSLSPLGVGAVVYLGVIVTVGAYGPVSYTHLDVYKRQISGWAIHRHFAQGWKTTRIFARQWDAR